MGGAGDWVLRRVCHSVAAAPGSAVVVSQLLGGHRDPSLGAAAALAEASGGRLVVRYEPPSETT